MSDREKGIINATDNILPLCSKAFCSRHIAKNLRSMFRDSEAMSMFWMALKTFSIAEFDEIMSKLENHNPRFHTALIDIGTHKWANSMFPVPRFGKNTSNPVESMNSALKDFIGKDITALIIAINNYSMEIFSERRRKRFQSTLAGNIQKILDTNIRESVSLSVSESSTNLFFVEKKFKVNLAEKSCECNQGHDMGIPCKHLCAVLSINGVDPSTFVLRSYSAETYYSQFALSIMPLSSNGLVRSNVLPPAQRRARGRPKIRRIRAPFEIN